MNGLIWLDSVNFIIIWFSYSLIHSLISFFLGLLIPCRFNFISGKQQTIIHSANIPIHQLTSLFIQSFASWLLYLFPGLIECCWNWNGIELISLVGLNVFNQTNSIIHSIQLMQQFNPGKSEWRINSGMKPEIESNLNSIAGIHFKKCECINCSFSNFIPGLLIWLNLINLPV